MSIVSRVAPIGARSLVASATVALLIGAAVPALGAAHSPSVAKVAPGFQVPVYAGTSPDEYAPIRAPQSSLLNSAGTLRRQTSTITVSYHNFSNPAKAAFQ